MNQRPDGASLADDPLAERLRHLRKQAGLSQKALAERLGISGPAIAQWETGRHRPDTRWLPKLASLLNCQPSDLRPDLFLYVPITDLNPLATAAKATPSSATPSIATLPSLAPLPLKKQQLVIPESMTSQDDKAIDWSQHADLVRLESMVVADSIPEAVGLSATESVLSADSPTIPITFSPLQLRRARQQRRLERRELAVLLHVDAFKIQQWEQGAAIPNEWQSHRLAQVLGLRQGQLRATANRVKFTVLQAPNAVRVPILPIYDQPPSEPTHAVIGHMPALHQQATLVFRLPAGRWAAAASTADLHVQVSPCQANDLPDDAKAVRVIERGLCLRQRICLEGQLHWFTPASRFGTAECVALQPDEWVWRVWAVVSLSSDELQGSSTSEWHAYT